ncbi:uncharacterized protein LOC133930222 [Phragmites australis]|uniref:uncharacterized protein LOC133930222 n=1 Tax=Phragmites australis TaxID=29695 RepID=UPI002D7657FB|nr:uncharacterized protein LOC133930222 [Phragmites australis]
MEVALKSYNKRHIDVLVREAPESAKWRGTFVYGEPKSQDRHHMWTLLRRIKPNATEPWLMIDDFNEAMWQSKHFSHARRPEGQMRAFRESLSFCDLHDLGFGGTPWTYDNKQGDGRNVRVRLDRAVADPAWSACFPLAHVSHIASSCSDHVPLLLLWDEPERPRAAPRCRRYEAMWERDASMPDVIKEAWEKGEGVSNLGDVMAKLRSTLTQLHTWSDKKVGNVKRKLGKLRKRLGSLRQQGLLDGSNQIREVREKLDELLFREEIMWRQRSRTSWLKEGDRNTRYFHRKASWRARKNRVTKLKKQDGSSTSDAKEMKHIAQCFFQDLLSRDVTLDPGPLLDMFSLKVDQEMNESLTKAFTDEEISDALFQIGPTKAPGPDGFPACFFQRNWALLKEDVLRAVHKFFEECELQEEVNDTTIVMIPKHCAPEEMKDYRPISLCNVVYKVVSKCLVNRLRPLLQGLISEQQSAFVPGRMITDNALIAFECFHSIQKCRRENQNFCALKLDLSKAYDYVDWVFLERVIEKMGFSQTWIKWIMICVTTVRYKVRFNGELLEAVSPSRGLRQGDPLSPYLFLFIADGLSNILKRYSGEGRIQPLKVCRKAPGVSHLLFADDSLLFFKAELQQARAVKEALTLYERSTGQLINPSKCSLLFSDFCSAHQQDEIKDELQVSKATFEDKYLGLPTPEGRMKAEKFQPIRERFAKRLSNWSEKFLSAGAKEVLIKSVAQALPNYVMGVFKLPLQTCEVYDRMVRKFWWGEDKGQRKVHWLAWEKLTCPKSFGGMGFRDMKCFNQALLARQAWRLLVYPDSFCARILKARYYPNGTLIDTAFPVVSSLSWKRIAHGMDLLKEGVIWRIGNGKDVRIWRHKWVPHAGKLKVIEKKTWNRLTFVHDLILPGEKKWNEPLIRHLTHDDDADVILKSRIPVREREDFPAWHFEKNGVFSVKSAYRLAWNLSGLSSRSHSSSSAPDDQRKLWKVLWRTDVQPKVSVFAWRLAHDSLPTMRNKWRRTLESTGVCKICGHEVEDGHHATVRCSKAMALRLAVREYWELPDEFLLKYTGPDWLLVLLDSIPTKMKTNLLLVLWRSWHLRNDIIHEKGLASIADSVSFLKNFRETLSPVWQQEVDHKGKLPISECIIPEPIRRNRATSDDVVWRPPPEGWAKINVDGAFRPESGEASVGIIARDCRGLVLYSAYKAVQNCNAPIEVEALACLEGARAAANWVQMPVIFESDNATVIQDIVAHQGNRAAWSPIIDEIHGVCSRLQDVQWHKLKRDCNRVAHFLAKMGMSSRLCSEWILQAPPAIFELLAQECNTLFS